MNSLSSTLPSRSTCPINYTLELIGDHWSLLIIRDIVFADKKTFGEFLQSEEKIARNILASRLRWLTAHGILQKDSHPTDGRKDVFTLTQKGAGLIPLLLQAADWGVQNYAQAEHFPKLLGRPPYANRQNVQKLRNLITKSTAH